ncbi:hypothetical protein DWX04_07605 [Phocaeicola vulgatus]|uniref:Uncharacterized protein n=1 Tax=Phocaeicola vulgatus TaxID=821 RepID=A0A412QW53_PHOVU|nr:hypothetical protein DWX04_07605 [Phocaeicola vulgatus]
MILAWVSGNTVRNPLVEDS